MGNEKRGEIEKARNYKGIHYFVYKIYAKVFRNKLEKEEKEIDIRESNGF